jgi:acetyl esterase
VAHDPLCDEGRAYAARLEAEGVQTLALHLGDHVHGTLLHGKLVRASNMIVDLVGAAIGHALHHGEPARA